MGAAEVEMQIIKMAARERPYIDREESVSILISNPKKTIQMLILQF